MSPTPEVLDLPTSHGPARVHLHPPAAPSTTHPCALVLGHGAGGGVGAPDLVAVTEVATGLGLTVALVEQPYRVAGRRGSPPAATLDTGWTQVVTALTSGPLAGLDLIVGGRSAGARVACRTALTTGACAVLCLAFPVQPPGRPDRPDRLPELDGAGVPVLVVQGERDPFGRPPEAADRRVVVVSGDHSLRAGLAQARAAVGSWLVGVLDGPG